MHDVILSRAGMSLHTHHSFQVRLGQTWKVQDQELGLRVCLVDQIIGEHVLMRTVFDEGLIGASETKVPMQTLLQRKDRWEYVSEPILRVA
jgi:hypothetical protein